MKSLHFLRRANLAGLGDNLYTGHLHGGRWCGVTSILVGSSIYINGIPEDLLDQEYKLNTNIW